ncbi:MAG: IS66 family transposase [Chitinophagales bacterium]
MLQRRPSKRGLLAIIDELRAENKELKATIAKQNDKIASLESELAQYRTPKNSGNSSLPPSSDFAPPKRNQSLREKSDKKPGGQFGHEGHTLQMKEQPDEIVEYKPCLCGKCGKDLAGMPEAFIEERQVVELPPVKPVYKAHRIYRKTCSCGHITDSPFPNGVNAPIQYGSSVESTIVYLHSRQFLPYERMAEYFKQVMNLPVSPGTLNNTVHRFAEKASPAYNSIKAAIEQAQCVGSDETGGKVNGKKHWFWTWQNDQLTFIIHSPSRGFDTIESTFPFGLPDTILVHDRWAAQLKCDAQGHQICMAHLLRDLNYIEQLHGSQWATDLKGIIKEAIALKGQLTESDYLLPIPQRVALENKLQQVLEQPIPANHDKAITLQKSLTKIQQYILRFLYHAFVPADNNGSERAVRNVKVKQKVSGQFKSEQGADDFAVIRSIIDTAVKAGKDVYNELVLIANLVPG